MIDIDALEATAAELNTRIRTAEVRDLGPLTYALSQQIDAVAKATFLAKGCPHCTDLNNHEFPDELEN